MSFSEPTDAVARFRAVSSVLVPGGLTDPDADVVALVGEIGCAPEALELAAKAARTRPVRGLVAALRAESPAHRGALGDLLQLGARRLGELQADDRNACAALSIFNQPFSLEHATTVLAGLGISDPESALGSLITHQVVERQHDGPDLSFRLPGLYRIPARGILRTDSALHQAAQRGLRRWWLEFARSFRGSWFGSGQAVLFTTVDARLPELESLLSDGYTSDNGELVEILSELWPYWSARSMTDFVRQHLPAALASGRPNPRECFDAQWALGWLALGCADAVQAQAAITAAEKVSTGSPEEHARLAQLKGMRQLYLGETREAQQLLEQALRFDVSNETGMSYLMDVALLAAAASLAGDQATAYDYCERAIALCEKSGEQWLKNYVIWAFAISAWREGDRRRAFVLARDGANAAAEVADQHAGAICLEILAWYEAAEGDARAAARLLGVADAIRVQTGLPIAYWGTETDHQTAVDRATERLGPSDFWRAFRASRQHGLAETVAWQNVATPAEQYNPAGPASSSELTPRQREIADLIAEGRSNKEIARLLLITVRTVETHVEHIFTKLGVMARTQVAAWSARQHEVASAPPD